MAVIELPPTTTGTFNAFPWADPLAPPVSDYAPSLLDRAVAAPTPGALDAAEQATLELQHVVDSRMGQNAVTTVNATVNPLVLDTTATTAARVGSGTALRLLGVGARIVGAAASLPAMVAQFALTPTNNSPDSLLESSALVMNAEGTKPTPSPGVNYLIGAHPELRAWANAIKANEPLTEQHELQKAVPENVLRQLVAVGHAPLTAAAPVPATAAPVPIVERTRTEAARPVSTTVTTPVVPTATPQTGSVAQVSATVAPAATTPAPPTSPPGASAAPLSPVLPAPPTNRRTANKLLFGIDSSALTAQDKLALDKIADEFKNAPAGSILDLSGHASTTGTDSHNDALSAQRAEEAKKYLVTEKGIDSNRIQTEADGSKRNLVKQTARGVEDQENRAVTYEIKPQAAATTRAAPTGAPDNSSMARALSGAIGAPGG